MEGSSSQAGFYYQNNIAALKIIECLFFNSDIRQIRLENYDKGNHIDDIIIYRENKMEYYQVKWSEDEGKSYTLYNLLTAESPKKSIFKQLAEGYLIAKRNSEFFSITLFTTKKESNQKRPSEGLNHGLSDMRTNIFEPLKLTDSKYDSLTNYETYKDSIEKIRLVTSLDENSFTDFIKKLEFKFSQEGIEEIQNILKFKLETLGIETSRFEKLLNAVVKWSISGESITKDLVLTELGIASRFEDKLSHYFKVVDDEFYVPNQSFFEQLEYGLTELEGGYIFIEGLPGIGKSTALTKFKEQYHDVVALAYYCFIPDAKNDFGEFRHQSYYFLKSLCIAIERNFPEVDLPSKYSERYEEKLTSYIEELSTLKKKIIFIIDGLDHVHRDTSIGDKSLLNNIKGDLPDNIYFILSSQYDSVLSSSVKLQIKSDPRRHIKVSPFTQPEIQLYLKNKGIDTNNILDTIERVSGGIPIYLHYISELLTQVEKNDYEKVLGGFPILTDGKINSYHEYLFQKIKNDAFAKWILAVLAYRKENTTIEIICEILTLIGENKTVTEIENVIYQFSHLLRQIDGRSYSIFHNSFREFILSKTEDLKDTFNKALISFYEQTPFTDEAYRNYFSHLYEGREYEKIISATSLEWLKSAWSNYRSFKEIKDNLKIAIKATIEASNLSEFIRIAFLKAQFDLASWNLENSEINFSTLLLNVGETPNSLRCVWDGDFVLTNKEYFCYYLGEYYKKTKNALPYNIINQGLSKYLKDISSKSITQELKAKALISDDLEELFYYVDSITWEESNEHTRRYIKKSHSEEQNARTNLKIKFEIIDHLVECRQYQKLFQLSKIYKEDKKLNTKIQIALIKLLLPIQGERKTTIKIIKDIDFTNISDKTYFKLISFCSDFFSDKEVRELFPARNLPEPELFEKVVDAEGMHYVLRKEIISLYNYLKCVWIFQPELILPLNQKSLLLSSPATDIYSSIFTLSELWNKTRNNKPNDIANSIRKSIDSLYVKKEKEFRTRSQGLFDMDTDSTFIAGSIKYLFENIFHLSAELLTKEELEKLVDYWINLDKSGDGFRHYSVGLAIANEINNSRLKNITDLTHKVITHAEETARIEQETISLTSYLGEVAESYGIYGFKDDFQRVYNQLFEISFGIGSRKDYQSSDIIKSLEFVHGVDPDGTLDRLSEVLHIQDRLSEVGNSRTQHICLSYFIRFSASRYPELAFKLMELEESNIARDEATDITINPLIESCSNDDLELYLSIIKTLPRWENGSHFLSLAEVLLKRAIHFNNSVIIEKILDAVKFNAFVELEDAKELRVFSEILIEKGIDHTIYSLPDPNVDNNNSKAVDIISDYQDSNKDKFTVHYDKLEFEELIQLFEDDYEEFENHIQSQLDINIQNRRNQSLRKEYHSVKSLFDSFYDTTSPENKQIIEMSILKIIRNFVGFKNDIVYSNSDCSFNLREFEELVVKFVSQIGKLLSNTSFEIYINEKIDIEKLFENTFRNINWRRDSLLYSILSDKEVLDLVDQCSIMNIENLLQFIDKWTQDRTKSASLLKIANRLAIIDSEKAKEIVLQASQYDFDGLLFPRNDDPNKLDFDIIDTILNIDKEFGKKFLLNSYYVQKGKYSSHLTNSLDKLLKYQEYFDSESIKVYYDANLLYNKELALGLPDKENKYEFISRHSETLSFPEITIKHLVWLFNYPAVKIRELVLQSVFDLIENKPNYIKIFIHFGVEKGNNNEIEYSIIILQAIAIRKPSILFQFKSELMSLLKKEHFNITETTKELLFIINQFDNSFLTLDEISILESLNTTSSIIFESSNLIYMNKTKDFLYSNFQWNLICELNEKDEEFSMFDSIYSDIISKGWIDYDIEKEGGVHQRYNINTNFDIIEIQSPYYDEVKDSINKVFYSKIKRSSFDSLFIEKIRTKFRVYDPSKLLYSIFSRPSYINWISESISADDFLNFSDFDSLVNEIINREEDYITLFECGNQWINKYGELNGACRFEVRAFLKKTDFDLIKLNILPFIQLENQYAYEMPLTEYDSSSFPHKEIVPLIQISYNTFRGEQELANVNLISNIFSDLDIEEKKLLSIFTDQESYPLNAIRWINSYKSGPNWRRYKPSSDGFTLKIKKEILLDYLQKNDLILCYNFELKRSTDNDRSEKYMNWVDLNRDVEINGKF